MTSIREEAKKLAEQELQKEEHKTNLQKIEAERKINAEKNARDKYWSDVSAEFHKHLQERIAEIEAVLDRMKIEGIVIKSVSEKDYNITRQHPRDDNYCCGKLGVGNYRHNHHTPDPRDKETSHDDTYDTVYFMIWKLVDVESGSEYSIALGLNCIHGHHFWNKDIIAYEPSITTEEVESKIKRWLINLYKRK